MKYIFFSIIFLCFQAHADHQSLVWIVAPEIWSTESPELKAGIENLESYLQNSLAEPVKVEIKTGKGFALSQYYSLQEELKTAQPDYIFYIESSRLLAKDFEEILLSKNLPNKALTRDFFSEDEILKYQPGWSRTLLPNFSFIMPIKRAIFIQNRLNKHWKNEDSSSDETEFYLDISFTPYQVLKFLLKDKEKIIFLISPERTKYSREIFSDNALNSSLAQMFFQGANVGKEKIKDYLSYSGLNYQLLPAEFFQLLRSDNLVSGSRNILNSSGINKSFQIIKPMISSYLVMEKNKKENEEKLKIEAQKSKNAPKKAKRAKPI
ncbi:MAG: hypothetical protein JSU04_00705 [Bdellovibrionales bacterium]|nr:hypothetical protein [Bdellovibrionales bacterium]